MQADFTLAPREHAFPGQHVHRSLAQGMLDALPAPVLALSPAGRILCVNRAGDDLLARGNPLLVRFGMLRARCPAAQAALDSAIRCTAQRLLRLEATGGSLWIRCCRASHDPQVLVLSVIGERAPPVRVIQALFAFTAAEAEVTRLLVDGATVKGIAHHRGVSVETVRTQVRNAMAKAGVRRQIELARALLAVPHEL